MIMKSLGLKTLKVLPTLAIHAPSAVNQIMVDITSIQQLIDIWSRQRFTIFEMNDPECMIKMRWQLIQKITTYLNNRECSSYLYA